MKSIDFIIILTAMEHPNKWTIVIIIIIIIIIIITTIIIIIINFFYIGIYINIFYKIYILQ